MEKHLFYNTGSLLRFLIRRDRLRIPIWILAITLITIVTAAAFPGLYANETERQIVAETMRNPAMLAMVGPGYGLDNYTNGAMMAHQMLVFTALAVAIMSILLVTRHTRADEESGRIELIRSLPAGRLANLTSTMIILVGTNIFLALAVGLGLFALGIESMDLHGSLVYGAALGVAGILFAAITALFAQLSESSRGTLGYSFAVLGITYLIRAVGDANTNETVSLFSPLGWIAATQAYVNNYWWPILLTLALSLVIFLVAMYLNSIRDLEAAFISSKPGNKNASVFLQSPMGLALNLQRTSIISWAVAMLLLGASYGSVLGDLEAFFEGSEMMREMLPPVEGFSLTEQYLTMLMSVISMICTIPAMLMILKLIGEERKTRTEHLLARAVSRIQLIGSYTLIAFFVGFLMLFLAVLGLWGAGTVVMEGALSFQLAFSASMAFLPAMWVMIGLAAFLIGVAPQATTISWLYLGYSFFVVYFGGLLQFPEWLGKLSPFGNIPKIPVESFDVLQVSIVAFIGFVLLIVGFIGYQRRDITG